MVAGPPKYHYRLHSVVRHLGSSPLAGHYIADVFRFCLVRSARSFSFSSVTRSLSQHLEELLLNAHILTGLTRGVGGDMTILKSPKPGEFEFLETCLYLNPDRQ